MSIEIETESPAPPQDPFPAVDESRVDGQLVTVIRPTAGWQLLNLPELWKYRELLYFLTWRDVKVRYKQTLLGAAWAVLQPAMMMVVFNIFFGRMAKVSSGDWPYPVFVYAGLLPWTFFSTAISNAGASVVGSERLITKVYFPRLAIPFASVGAALVDFAIAFLLLGVLMVWYQVPPTASLLLVPLLIGLAMLCALGVGTMLAALNVAYRDFRYVIPFLVQLWLFATPTVYMQTADMAPERDRPKAAATAPADAQVADASQTSQARAGERKSSRGDGAVSDDIQRWLNLNPMTGLIAFFRAATLGGPLPWTSLGYSALGVTALFFIGCFYFRRVEDGFADII